MTLTKQNNEMEEYVNRLIPVFLIGISLFLIFIIFAFFHYWLDLPKATLVYVGLGAVVIQIICSIFYVVWAWKNHGYQRHDSCK